MRNPKDEERYRSMRREGMSKEGRPHRQHGGDARREARRQGREV